MADLFSDVVTAFREKVAAAWSETVPNGIWEAEEALTRSFERNLTLPYAIIEIPTFTVSDRDGITNRAWRPTFNIYYVAEVEGDSGTLRERMKALADELETPLTTGQIIPPNVQTAWGRDLEPNALLILLNATQRAGCVSGTVAVGVTRY